jgi:uncharacterized protein (TIGR04255 family)
MSSDFSTSDWPSRRLPEYRRPPVIETALAIEFAPIKGWNIVQYGSLWECFKSRYPKVEVYPAPQEVLTRPELDLANPPIRCFFIGSGDNQLVQIRAGAFVRGWRANQSDQEYPRYKSIRPSFEEDLNLFLGFLQQNGCESPEIWKCEVTYVNHFLRGREWHTASELTKSSRHSLNRLNRKFSPVSRGSSLQESIRFLARLAKSNSSCSLECAATDKRSFNSQSRPSESLRAIASPRF